MKRLLILAGVFFLLTGLQGCYLVTAQQVRRYSCHGPCFSAVAKCRKGCVESNRGQSCQTACTKQRQICTEACDAEIDGVTTGK